MAKHTVECARCGEDMTVQLWGKHSKRKWKLENYTWKCDACKEEQRQEENAANAQANAERGLPELVGSDKQIAWAETIRAGKREGMEEQREVIEGIECKTDEQRAEKAFALQVIDEHIEETSAGTWIDRRDMIPRKMVRKAHRRFEQGERAEQTLKSFVAARIDGWGCEDTVDLTTEQIMTICAEWQEKSGVSEDEALEQINAALFEPSA